MKRLFLSVLLLVALLFSVVLAEGYEVGDTLFFGHYEQDNDASDGWEPIEWYVLDKRADGSYLLISRYALDCKPYKTSGTETNWDKSLLRLWLNEEFFIRAFNSDEQESIALSLVTADNREIEGYDAGADTMDKVFVFGFSQSLKYLSDSDWEFCAPTAFAAANGVKQSEDMEVDGKGACWYWLRSVSANHIAYHSPGPGFDVNAAGVRPVIWAYVKP